MSRYNIEQFELGIVDAAKMSTEDLKALVDKRLEMLEVLKSDQEKVKSQSQEWRDNIAQIHRIEMTISNGQHELDRREKEKSKQERKGFFQSLFGKNNDQ